MFYWSTLKNLAHELKLFSRHFSQLRINLFPRLYNIAARKVSNFSNFSACRNLCGENISTTKLCPLNFLETKNNSIQTFRRNLSTRTFSRSNFIRTELFPPLKIYLHPKYFSDKNTSSAKFISPDFLSAENFCVCGKYFLTSTFLGTAKKFFKNFRRAEFCDSWTW